MPIHPTAIIDRSSEIDASAEIGPYAVIERGCKIGPNVRLYAHAYVSEGTTLAAGVQVHPFAVVGHLPQDVKFTGEPSYTVVGEGTVIREHATIHRGTTPGSTTTVGRNCFIMSTGHVAHNCTIGDHVIIANGGLVAGHVQVGDRAFISGNVVVHQFCRIGELAMLGGLVGVSMDVPPFMSLRLPHCYAGANVVGLRRAGFSPAERQEIRTCLNLLVRSGRGLPRAIERIATLVQTDPGRRLLAFLQAPTKRGVFVPRSDGEVVEAH
ncbi:MAG: acyl-ACP--UDP-N-acetylglucosamine O-acyltransferase [Phycisphaerales bacterium]|nr:acyl-ACP--UDP-N-acetylglucosamine O-acyltransferase [Phycisphaerales bacterium]